MDDLRNKGSFFEYYEVIKYVRSDQIQENHKGFNHIWSPHTMYKCNIQRMNPYYLYLCHRWFNILDYWHVNVILISYYHANPASMSNSTSFAHWWNVITETDNSKCKYIRNKISFLGGVYEDIITFHILVACKVCGKLLQIEHINTGRVLEFHYHVTNAERC